MNQRFLIVIVMFFMTFTIKRTGQGRNSSSCPILSFLREAPVFCGFLRLYQHARGLNNRPFAAD